MTDLPDSSNESSVERGITGDGMNAVIFGFIEGFSDRVKEDAEALEADLDDGERVPFDIPVSDRGIRVFQIHSMGIAYIESCAILLLHDTIHRQVEPECSQLHAYAADDHQYSRYIDETDTQESNLTALLDFIYSERSSLSDYERLIDGAGILDEPLINQIGQVRNLRGTFIHSPETLINLSSSTEVKDVVDECVEVVSEMEEICRETLDLHELYHHFTDYTHTWNN